MRRLALAAGLVLAVACTSKHTTFTGELKLGKTADDNYQSGIEELKAKHYEEAVRFFEYVKTKYPYSKFAALADLRLADAKFEQDRFPEAAEAYNQFVQLHPTNEDVDYAEYRAALSYFKDAPSDFMLFPPSYEKDQRQTEKAVEALTKFVKERPNSKYLGDAEKTLADAKTRLASREWYVAEYYYKRDRWAGAAGRYEVLVEKYPGFKYEADALYKLAHACIQLNEKFRARTALQQLIVKHPEDPRRAEAEKLLASLR
jgi:outer membrane protein assembly factor BamD